MDPLKTAKLHRHASGILNEIQTGESREQKAAAFIDMAKALMLSDNKQAHHAVAASGNSIVKAALQKSAVDPNLLTDSGLWGGGPLGELAASYIASTAEQSLLDALMAGGATVIPANIGRALVATGGAANVTGEGAPKAVMRPLLNSEDATTSKCAEIVVLSDELARETGTALFEAELTKTVVRGCNAAVLDVVVDSNTPTASTLAGAMALAGASDGYVVAMPAGEVAALAVTNAGNGGTLGVRGGMLCPGVVIVAIDGATSTIVIPASKVAIRDHGLQLRPAAHASIEIDESPVGGASAVWTSLFQQNLKGLLVEREFELACDTSKVVIVEAV